MIRVVRLLALIGYLTASPVSANPSTDCGTTSKSSSGYAQICANCASEYFYLYANQYVCIENGRVVRESHSFSMSGSLSSSSQPKLLGLLNNWVVWETENVFLAVPAHGEQEFYAKNKRQDRNGLSLAGWYPLTN